MGIFGFKKKFDIVPKKEKMLNIVNTYGIKKAVKINARLVVPENFVFVLGKKGKVTDKFESGEHFFNFSNLPHTCRRFGIDKIKKGKQKDGFNADLYFINKCLFPGKFKTYRKVEMGTKAYGFYSMHVYGVYSYRVFDAKEFMQSLLNEFDYIKTGEAEEMIENWVSELVVTQLEKQNFIVQDVLAQNPRIEEVLKQKVSKLFAVAGLELVEFKIEKFKLPKKYEDKKKENQQTTVLKSENTTETLVEETVSTENITNLEDDKDEVKHNKTSIDDDINEAKQLLKQFGLESEHMQSQNFDKEEPNNEGVLQHSNEETVLKDDNFTTKEQTVDVAQCSDENVQNEGEYIPFGNFKIKEKSNTKIKSQEKTFVDLNLDKIYNEKKHTKRCLGCGAENSENATICILCGDKLNNE